MSIKFIHKHNKTNWRDEEIGDNTSDMYDLGRTLFREDDRDYCGIEKEIKVLREVFKDLLVELIKSRTLTVESLNNLIGYKDCPQGEIVDIKIE